MFQGRLSFVIDKENRESLFCLYCSIFQAKVPVSTPSNVLQMSLSVPKYPSSA